MTVLLLLALAQAKPDPARVEEAVQRGVRFLKASNSPHDVELVLLALAHGGVAAGDPAFAEPLAKVLKQDLRMTYRAALLAMTLEEVDRLRHQPAIARCAQFLLDNQGDDGQWGYGSPTTYPEFPVASVEPAEEVDLVVFEEPRPGAKPAVRQRIRVLQQRIATAGGDNSNSQYAALGLRACHEAGIRFPAEVVKRAADWWRRSQGEDGGWSYGPRGSSYGSMTAGAVGARAITLHLQGKDWKDDPVLRAGLGWLGKNFTTGANPGRGANHLYYYLYGAERAGMLCGVERFGGHEWYLQGARQLLDLQKPDGSWTSRVDSAFAVLFLKRATRSMVESGR